MFENTIVTIPNLVNFSYEKVTILIVEDYKLYGCFSHYIPYIDFDLQLQTLMNVWRVQLRNVMDLLMDTATGNRHVDLTLHATILLAAMNAPARSATLLWEEILMMKIWAVLVSILRVNVQKGLIATH